MDVFKEPRGAMSRERVGGSDVDEGGSMLWLVGDKVRIR